MGSANVRQPRRHTERIRSVTMSEERLKVLMNRLLHDVLYILLESFEKDLRYEPGDSTNMGEIICIFPLYDHAQLHALANRADAGSVADGRQLKGSGGQPRACNGSGEAESMINGLLHDLLNILFKIFLRSISNVNPETAQYVQD